MSVRSPGAKLCLRCPEHLFRKALSRGLCRSCSVNFYAWRRVSGNPEATVEDYLKKKPRRDNKFSTPRSNTETTVEEIEMLLSRIVHSDATVLLTGETGVGKEFWARKIHAQSYRRDRPFVPVDCPTLVDSLAESELFGYERGSFTGAVGSKEGLIESASGGTLFLDEVCSLPRALQPKLLRLLDRKEFRCVGGTSYRVADVRVIAASNSDLLELVDTGVFRKDLYYRLSVFPIDIPPLRRRSWELNGIVETLLGQLNGGKKSISPVALECLRGYHWPGNIRELRNVLERAGVLCNNDLIMEDDLPKYIRRV